MKRLLPLLECMLADAGMLCRTSTTRDLKTILSRFEHEGESFLTITLANFGADLHKGLDQGFVDSSLFQGFSRREGLPVFLRGFLSQVFEEKTGLLLLAPSCDAIQAIRQLTLAFAKIKSPCTKKRDDNAIAQYLECEKELKSTSSGVPQRYAGSFQRIRSRFLGQFLQDMDETIFYEGILPGHGPGATADKLKGNLKWMQREWPERLDSVFPATEYLSPSRIEDFPLDRRVKFLEPGAERPVKVITVPKTLKTPRIIAMEPTAMMYVQQGLHALILDTLSRPEHKLVESVIGYSSQVPNQELARSGSLLGDLATLDLSEASDRVHNQHVRELFRLTPHLFEAVDATRSRKADVRGKVIRLAKFASMGSGLCFPVEAMMFSIIVFCGIEQSLNRPLSHKDFKTFVGRVRVYGDDIVVPVEHVPSVIESLEAFGLKVNLDKSFWSGKFRESCGKEYYNGSDVTITRIRSLLPTRQKHAEEIISTVATRNLFYQSGYWTTARYLDGILQGIIPYPVVSSSSPLLGRVSFLLSGFYPGAKRWDRDLHVPLVRGCKIKARIPASLLENEFALLKCLTKRSELPFADVRHLQRAGRPSVVDIKRTWASPY